MNAFETDLSSTDTVTRADGATAAVPVPVSCCGLTSTIAAPRMSINAVQSNNLIVRYPALNLPSPGGLPQPSSAKKLRSASPRNWRSPASSCRRQLLTNKTALEGQPRIDQFLQSAVSSSSSMCDSSSVPQFGQGSLSETGSCSMSLDRKQTRHDQVAVSPLLTRNRERFVELSAAKDFQPCSISDVGSSGSDENQNCTGANMQRERCCFDTTLPIKTNLAEPPVSTDVTPETAVMKNTQVASGEEHLESVKVSSAECSSSPHEKAATVLSSVKISLPKLEKIRQIWEANRVSMCEKSIRSCSRSEMTPKVASSSLVVGTEVNSVVTESTAPLASSCAMAAEACASTTAISSQICRSTIDAEVSDIVACDIEVSEGLSEPAANMDVSCNELTTSVTDDEVINAATHRLDSSHTKQQIDSGCDVKCNGVNSGNTTSEPATEVDASNEVKETDAYGGDVHMDIDSCELENFAPVESKPMFFYFISLNRS